MKCFRNNMLSKFTIPKNLVISSQQPYHQGKPRVDLSFQQIVAWGTAISFPKGKPKHLLPYKFSSFSEKPVSRLFPEDCLRVRLDHNSNFFTENKANGRKP